MLGVPYALLVQPVRSSLSSLLRELHELANPEIGFGLSKSSFALCHNREAGASTHTMNRHFASLFLIAAALGCAQTPGLVSADLLKLRSVGDVQWSPDGARIAYTVSNNDGPRRPYSQLWIMTVADGKSIRLAGEKESSSGPEWSPDGQWIAYSGSAGGKPGMVVPSP